MGPIFIFLAYLIYRILDFVIIYLAPNLIPYFGFFPYGERIVEFGLARTLSSLANFDGIHYLMISQASYSQYEQAFFPLYPVLIKVFSPFFANNALLAGIMISNLSFLLGLFLLNKYLKVLNLGPRTIWVFAFLLSFPTSFFFTSLYTEGLFFLLFVLSLYLLEKKRYLWASVFAGLASGTRLMGVFLSLPFSLKILSEIKKTKDKKNGQGAKLLRYLTLSLVLLGPLSGFFIYCLYLYFSAGDPLAFFRAQPIFGANRSTSLVLLPQVYFRYLKIFFSANWDTRYFVSLLEFFIFNLFFFVLIFDLVKIVKQKSKKVALVGLSFFSLANLILPTLTGTFSSVPRYALMSLSFFIALAKIKNEMVRLFLFLLFAMFHALILGLFAQGYFVG